MDGCLVDVVIYIIVMAIAKETSRCDKMVWNPRVSL
jgi:hypothetical protein